MSSTELDIQNDEDINRMREHLRTLANDLKFADYETTKLVTASSELARNILDYTNGGTVRINVVETNSSHEIRLAFNDVGPGIENVERAMEDGYQGPDSTGLGVGLPGAKRLSDEFKIESDVDDGTTVEIVIRST